MADIVERLRSLAAIDNCQTSIEAADEIERLRAALEKADEELAAAGYRKSQWPRPEIRAALAQGDDE